MLQEKGRKWDVIFENIINQTHLPVRDAFTRTNLRAISTMFVRLSVCPSGTGVHCDHTVHSGADLSLRLDSCGHPGTKAFPPTPSHLVTLIWNGGGVSIMQTRPDIARTVEDRC